MLEQERPYQEEFASNLVSGSVGLLGATAFGPAGALFGALGAPLGKSIIKEGVFPYLLNKIFPKRFLKIILKQKLATDFNISFLKDANLMQDTLSESTSILRRAGMINISLKDKRILKDEISEIQRFALLDTEFSAHANELKPLETIKVSCTSIHPATVSVFKSLSNRLSFFNVKLEVFFEDINGHYQVLKSKKSDFDFAVFPNDAFFMIENSSETAYRLMFTINGQIQHLFRRKSRLINQKNQVYIYQDSSAHMQHLLGIGIPNFSENKIIERINDFSLIVKEMAGGDSIIVWEPLSSLLYKNSDYELIQGSEYMIYNSLFCHKSWNKPIMKKARRAFKNLFINEWRICNLNRKLCMEILLNDEEYLKVFADGAGISY